MKLSPKLSALVSLALLLAACPSGPPAEDCQNGVDDDGDSRVDCTDSDCAQVVACRESCFNGIDDNGDGAIDCDDADCAQNPACQQPVCGDGALEGDEECDGQDFGGASCQDFGFDSGNLACDDACLIDSSGCFNAEVCDDNTDNDLDGQTDCDDSDCTGDFLCPVCGDGAIQLGEQCDGANLDGQSCQDFGFNSGTLACDNACLIDSSGCFNVEICGNGSDDDNDGQFDCADPDCTGDPVCLEQGNCGDNSDNDLDGQFDCADSDCTGDPICLEQGNCDDSSDNDLDGQFDCADADCTNDPVCLEQGNCGDSSDNDLDGQFDCADSDCNNDPICLEQGNCDDNTDNDLDGQTDCDDSDCTGDFLCPVCGDGAIQLGEQCDGANLNSQSCQGLGFDGGTLACDNSCSFNTTGCFNFEVCDNTVDDDLDGQADCADSDCAAAPNCQEAGNCDDNTDNDLDGQFDCADADCNNDSICQEQGNCNDNSDNDLDGQTDCADSDCDNDPICQEAGNCDDNIDNDLDGQTDCDDSDCAGDFLCPVCGDGAIQLGEQCDGANLDGQSCQNFGFNSGNLACDNACQFDTTGCADVEICANGIDDDGDLLIDCGDDIDCEGDVACGDTPTGGVCVFGDECDGGVCLDEVVNGFPDGYCSETCDLAAGLCGADGDGICADVGLGNGQGLCLDACSLSGNDCGLGYSCVDIGIGNGDGVCFADCTDDAQCPAAGFCNADDGLCNTSDETCFNGFDDDDDSFIDCNDLDCADDPFCSLFENCDNLVDDDGDGAIDCNDFDCASICGDACLAPVIAGDPSTQTSSNIGRGNLTDGSCQLATGGGGGAEIAFLVQPAISGFLILTLDSAADLGVYVQTSCGDPGSEIACAELAFGGTTETLQVDVFAGETLFVFVDGFAPGEEDTFTLQIATQADPIEICASGVDDDGDGFIDCNDLDCVGDPFCAVVEDCANGIDDDGDLLIDCGDDIDCEGDVACGDTPTGGVCVFGDECDGGVCLDEVVNGFPDGYCSETCDLAAGLCGADGDGICADVGLGNGQGLCLDACSLSGNDCGLGYSCVDIGIGNGDGVCFADCTDDAQCPAAGFCNADDGLCNTSDETCFNGFDDDDDSFLDCDDFDCAGDPFCAAVEDCANNFDDDGDGFIDCQDIDCDIECQDACFFPIPVDDPSTLDSSNIGRGDITDGSCQLATGGGAGAEIAFLFQPAFDSTLNLQLDSGADLVLYVQTSCGDPGSEIACSDQAFGGATEELQVDVFAGETLFVFVDGFAPGEESTFTLQVFTQ